MSRLLDTPEGPARLHVRRGDVGAVVLTHGAGGGVGAPDLVAASDALSEAGWSVVLVEMPWRVAGKRVASPARRLDAAWVPVLTWLTRGRWALPRPLIVGGRSAGARVACRTAVEVGADAVLAMSFPLVPPGKGPEKSRIGELLTPLDAGLPVLVTQGHADAFGTGDDVRRAVADSSLGPAEAVEARRLSVCDLTGAHSFRRAPDGLAAAVLDFAAEVARPSSS